MRNREGEERAVLTEDASGLGMRDSEEKGTQSKKTVKG